DVDRSWAREPYAGDAGREEPRRTVEESRGIEVETCGRADGVVGDPRRTVGTGHESRGTEVKTCCRADGRGGDPRRTVAGSGTTDSVGASVADCARALIGEVASDRGDSLEDSGTDSRVESDGGEGGEAAAQRGEDSGDAAAMDRTPKGGGDGGCETAKWPNR